MGGTRDGEIYEVLSEQHRRELEEQTHQVLIPLTPTEADLARLIEDSSERAKIFEAKAQDKKTDVENEMRKFLKEKGFII